MKKKKLQVHNQSTTDYEIRIEEHRGTTYWIVPVVMMVEGVHHGSRGPLLYTEEELSASVSAWSGMPLTIGHPKDEEGKYISANLPGVLDGIVGRIYNPKMDGDKLTAEAWIDVNALTELSYEAFEYIKEKKALDVSVGVFSEEVRGQGEYGGEAYRAEAVNLVPDHLALLPGEDGACSWDDGCGIRNNKKTKMKTNTKGVDKSDWLDMLQGHGACNRLTTNKASFSQIMQSIQEQLNALDNDMRVYYLEEIYDNYFVYNVVNRQSRERTLFKQNYSMKQDDTIEFQGDPTKVRKEVSFVAMSKMSEAKKWLQKAIKTHEFACQVTDNEVPQKLMLEEMNYAIRSLEEPVTPTSWYNDNVVNFYKVKHKFMSTNSKCSVDTLIQNEATQFTEDDREWLTAMSQEQLEKLVPKVEKKTEPAVSKAGEKKVDKEESLVTKGQDGSISINGKTMEEYIKESLGKESDPLKFIDNFMPDGLKDQMKSGFNMYQARRTKLVKDIAANSKFKEEQLKKWTDEDLEVLHATLVSEEEKGGHYAPLGGGSLEDPEEGGEEEINAMLSFAAVKTPVKEEKKK